MRYRKFDDVDAEDVNADSDSSSTGGGYAFGSGRSAGDTLGDKIVPGVFVSDLPTVKEHREKIDHGMDTVISVCQDAVEFEQAELVHLPIAESDGQAARRGGTKSFDQFVRAAGAIQDHIEAGGNVLVHCHAGINRSVGTTAAALGRTDAVAPEMDTFDALATIQNERPRANPLSLTRGWMQAWSHGFGHAEATVVDAIVGEVRKSARPVSKANRTRQTQTRTGTRQSHMASESRETARDMNQDLSGLFDADVGESVESAAEGDTDDGDVQSESESGLANQFLSTFFRGE